MSSRQTVRWAGVVGSCVALALAGCGSKVESGAPAQDSLKELPLMRGGARLQARAYQAGEATQFRYLYDRQLGVECSFVTNGVGNGLVCLPGARADVIYLDSSCTDPAIFLYYGSVGDWVSSGEDGSTCPGAALPKRSAYQIGEMVYASTIHGQGRTPVYARTERGCVPTEAGAKSDPPVLRLLPRSEGQFVAARIETVDVGGGFELERAIADDGTEQTLGVRNAQGVACSIQGNGQCVPGPIAVEQNSPALNADCSRPSLASPLAPVCGVPQFGVVSGPTPSVVELEPLTDAFSNDIVIDPSVPDGWSYQCNPTVLGSGYFSAGKPATGLPTARRVELGSSSLHTIVFGLGSDTAFVPLQADPGGLFNAHEDRCSVTAASDGSLRCLSEADIAYPSGYYEDAACTRELYFQAGPDMHPTAPTRLDTLRIVDRDASESVVQGLHSLRRASSTAYVRLNETCQPVPGDDQPWLVADQAVALDSLPLVTETEL